MDEGWFGGLDHFAVVDDLVDECFFVGGGGVEAVVIDFAGEGFGMITGGVRSTSITMLSLAVLPNSSVASTVNAFSPCTSPVNSCE